MGNALRVEGASCSRRPEEGSSGRWLLFSVVPCVFFGPWLYSREFAMAGMGWMIDVAFGFMRRCSGFRSQLALSSAGS